VKGARGRRLTLAVALVGVLAALSTRGLAQEVAPGEPIDFSLEETSGQTRTMAAVRGRVVILFYEDREHTELNRDFKENLHRFILDNQLQPQTTTYAIANTGGIADGVIRDMARTAIRAFAGQYGIQILLDWDGVLQRAPFSMAPADANVALCDRQGRIRWRHTGAIGETERRSFFRTLRQLLREPAPEAAPATP
jgi:predicted transcriptional regulator